jgi:hypothetical protein
MASRSSSRSVSCRKKMVPVIVEVEEKRERETSPAKMMRKDFFGESAKEVVKRRGQNVRAYSIIKTKKVVDRELSLRKRF